DRNVTGVQTCALPILDKGVRIDRSIPTCVGLGGGVLLPRSSGLVHPHVRGAWGKGKNGGTGIGGPSPRAWGLGMHSRPARRTRRSIPTCVGLGNRHSRQLPHWAVHPHVRGAWSICRRRCVFEFGPSPRAWGLAKSDHQCQRPRRSIPTCVGLGAARPAAAWSPPVHPHVRGAWRGPGTKKAPDHGPSPRAWGLDHQFQILDAPGRSIPTCVGLGASAGGGVYSRSVHPHVRGAWHPRPPVAPAEFRPSPRPWGLDAPPNSSPTGGGSIPTCVGLGWRPPGGTTVKPVHPHVRGAWRLDRSWRCSSSGPSPRAWGLDFPTCTNFRRYRFATKCAKATRTPVATPSPSVVNLMVRATPSATYV